MGTPDPPLVLTHTLTRFSLYMDDSWDKGRFWRRQEVWSMKEGTQCSSSEITEAEGFKGSHLNPPPVLNLLHF